MIALLKDVGVDRLDLVLVVLVLAVVQLQIAVPGQEINLVNVVETVELGLELLLQHVVKENLRDKELLQNVDS